MRLDLWVMFGVLNTILICGAATLLTLDERTTAASNDLNPFAAYTRGVIEVRDFFFYGCQILGILSKIPQIQDWSDPFFMLLDLWLDMNLLGALYSAIVVVFHTMVYLHFKRYNLRLQI